MKWLLVFVFLTLLLSACGSGWRLGDAAKDGLDSQLYTLIGLVCKGLAAGVCIVLFIVL